MTATPCKPHLRWMVRRDLPDVLMIEGARTDSGKWDGEDFVKANAHRDIVSQVAEVADNVVGYIVYRLNADHIELLNLAVDERWRRRRVGKVLIAKTTRALGTSRKAVSCVVRETNLPAQLFLRACGFWAFSLERQYFPDSGEDGIVMEFHAQADEEAA